MAASMRMDKRMVAKTQNQLLYKDDNKYQKANINLIEGFNVWILICCFYFTILVFIMLRMDSFPRPQSQFDDSRRDQFYEGNAEKHLHQLVVHGPRVVGSEANEKYAREYILNVIHTVQKSAYSKSIEISEQNVSGSFDLAFLSDFTSVYKNIKNIVVKLIPEGGAKDSLLINCHYDSSVESPGAGDNGISCAVMLELLRAISQSDVKLAHNILFLFNGAEENILQGSHGFITKHPWAGSVKAFVNLDSAGAGGWEVVFQTGPFHPWLVRAYAQSAPYPFGSIMGQDLFQSGLIPSDTDFRIFRDFGKLPGLDIAYISNGYVYHTENDKPVYINPGCIQRAGENLMSLLKALASDPKLANPGLDKHGTMVFFDVVGIFLVHYPIRIATIINSIIVAAVFFKLGRKAVSGSHRNGYIKDMGTVILVFLTTWIAVFAACLSMAMFMMLIQRPMTWFTYKVNMVPVYIFPGFIVAVYFQEFLRTRIKLFHRHDPWLVETLFFEGNLLIWSVLTLLLTINGLGSAYMPLLHLIGPLILRDQTAKFLKVNWKENHYFFILLHLASVSLPVLMILYSIHCMLLLFIPIMGRSGTEVNPDIFIAGVSAFTIIVITSYMIGLVHISKNIGRFIKCLIVVTVLWNIVIIFTSQGFPFSGNPDSPSPQRVLLLHTHRKFYNKDKTILREDSGLWMPSFDYTQYHDIIASNPTLQAAGHVTCDQGPYCGVPFLIPVLKLLHAKKSRYVKAGPLELPRVTAELVKTERLSDDTARFFFQVKGPDHTTMCVRTYPDVRLLRWSLSPNLPSPVNIPDDLNETTYFVYYSHGEKPISPWQFSIDLMSKRNSEGKEPIIDMAFAGHYLHGKNKMTYELQDFVNSLPDWSTAVSWSATYDSYQF
ncbi:hypothetical protein ACJMK2_041927 [Sinanodonta woodiana]|uniref:Endoplasmic reticulum metallopeptidase 1 n=1 Tax=Sinanodonta woodiana TaxID=1069815 RepID=A0ABD3W904_SINWO